jgi:hypothetical protein
VGLKEVLFTCWDGLVALSRRPEATFALALFVAMVSVWQVVIMRRQEKRDLAQAQVTFAVSTSFDARVFWRSGMPVPVEIPANVLGSLQLLVSNEGNAVLRKPSVTVEGHATNISLSGDAFTSGGGTNRVYSLRWIGPHFSDMLPRSNVGGPYGFAFGVRLGEGVSTFELVIRVTGEGLGAPKESVAAFVVK